MPDATVLSIASPFWSRAITFHRYEVFASRSVGYVNAVSRMLGMERVTCVATSVTNSSYSQGPGG